MLTVLLTGAATNVVATSNMPPAQQPQHISYRPEIDGLRAVAVLSVCLFHIGAPGFGGGFVGVDIFFVISGYLITGIIHPSIEAQSFSLSDFYARRARRILPALFLVMTVTGLLGWLILMPGELRELGRQIIATTLFSSNLLFFFEAGYFDAAAETKPLLMTWSLGVEEQFYLLWPLLLHMAVRLEWNRSKTVASFLVASFSIAYYATKVSPESAFYLLPFRAWELALGAMLAIYQRGQGQTTVPPRWIDASAGSIGLLAIIAALTQYSSKTPFPGFAALLPCLGAALIIYAGSASALVRLCLTNPLARGIGLISYSLYLWHWPLLAIARTFFRDEVPIGVGAAILALSAVLAYSSWRWIEQPFRHSSLSGACTIKRYLLASLGMILVAGMLIGTSKASWRTGDALSRADAAANDKNPLRKACHLDVQAAPVEPSAVCRQGQGAKKYLILGDSHADALAPGFMSKAAKEGHAAVQFSKTGCPPMLGMSVVDENNKHYESCEGFNEAAVAYLARHPEFDTVVLAARWAVYSSYRNQNEAKKLNVSIAPKTSDYASPDISLRNMELGVRNLVQALTRQGKHVILVTQIPEPGFNVPQCWGRKAMLGPAFETLLSCTPERREVWSRIDRTNAVLRRAASPGSHVSVLDLANRICDQQHCHTATQAGGVTLYSDDNHLSRSGAEWLVGMTSVTQPDRIQTP